PFLANYRPSELTVALVEKFKSAKLAERQQQQTAIERWRTLDPKTRARQPFPGLSHASINKCLKVLAQVLDDAVEFGYVETNVAGVRGVDLTPMLLDELKLHRADSEWSAADAVVFGTNRGTERNRSNITRQIVQPAIERANVELAKAGRTPIEHVTNHSLRR